jgi:Flp pilus assembly protein TadD
MLAEGHRALGMHHLTFDRNWSEAGKRLERAVALAPSDPVSLWAYSVYLTHDGDFAGGRRAITRALQLDPHSINAWNAKGWNAVAEGRLAEALASAETMLEMDASSWSGLWLKGAALRQLGDDEAARPELEAAVTLSGGLPGPKASLAHVLAAQGESEAVRAILDELLGAREVAYVPASQVARVYEALGDADEAIRWLELAYEEADGFLHLANRWPRYDLLRSDPRFQEILRRLALPE